MLQANRIVMLALLIAASQLWGDDRPMADQLPSNPTAVAVEQLTAKAHNAVVQITFTGRDGNQEGLGTGFIISTDGLVATNLHVLGEARPISVELADRRKFDVESIHASDRALDLAVVQIDAQNLPFLELGDSEQAQQGEPVIVLGNPFGLRNSVVSGVVSSRREIDGRKMLQLAMPIEPGNSGGPVLDRHGRVVGVVTMKSAVTENLGFAVEINQLQPLLEKPNPIPLSRWLTIGTLDPNAWTPLFGATWRRRSGHIVASGLGDDPFGQRSLCVSNAELPELPFELGVTVRLDDESGAAGLIFHSDGGDKHYGFYPSNGRLRLSRFEGPTVFQWHVLAEVTSEHYRPGDWNHLKIRFEPDKILCSVNDHLVIESTDKVLPPGKVGLAKFRKTMAQFKKFRVAQQLPARELSPEIETTLEAFIDQLPDLATIRTEQLKPLSETPSASTALLRGRAAQLERRAAELHRVANDLHVLSVARELETIVQEGVQADLLRAALLIAKLDDAELDIDPYLEEIQRMVADVRRKFTDGADEKTRLAALNDYLFKENGFHGSRTNYYHRANSYLSSVLDDREGLPITLSVLYMELGRRLDLRIDGVGLPGHFIVKHVAANGDEQFIDVFEGGRRLSRVELERSMRADTNQSLLEEHLRAVTRQEILLRMLRNLRRLAEEKRDSEAILRYQEAMLAINPEMVQERLMRAFARYHTGRRDAALADLDWLLERKPPELDLERIREARDYFQQNPPRADLQRND